MRLSALVVAVALIAGPAAAQTWRVETDRDDFTDGLRVRAVFAKRDIAGAVRCHDGALDAVFVVSYIGEKDATVRYRIDRGEVTSNVWDASTSRDSLFAWDPGDVARQMMAGSSMAFEHDDFAGTPHRYTISLAGSAGPIGRVLDACDVPRVSPRTHDDSIWVRVIDDLDKAPRSDISTIQRALAVVGYQVSESGRRDQPTYKALSDFYANYWRRCEADEEAGVSCSDWKSRRRYDADRDYTKEAIDLLAEVIGEMSRSQQAADAEAQQGAATSVITDVRWSRPPRVALSDYPSRAQEAGQSGSAVLECQARSNGSPSACMIVSETPDGFGFGRAAINVVQRALLSPSVTDSLTGEGRFRVTIGFEPST